MNMIKRRKRILLFSVRSQLRDLNKAIAKATDDIDVAYVEELMEERHRVLQNALDGKVE